MLQFRQIPWFLEWPGDDHYQGERSAVARMLMVNLAEPLREAAPELHALCKLITMRTGLGIQRRLKDSTYARAHREEPVPLLAHRIQLADV